MFTALLLLTLTAGPSTKAQVLDLDRAAAMEPQQPKSAPVSVVLSVVVTARGETFVDGTRTDLQHLRPLLAQAKKRSANAQVNITSAEAAPRRRTDAIVAMVTAAGITGYTVSEPTPGK